MAKAKAKLDKVTKDWVRNAADERAVAAGCRFDLERAEHAVRWIQTFCVLYEGEHAGEAMELRDWQLDFVMRIFGWVKHSEEWGREVRRFRRAGVWIPKKNKKSPTLAACGLYLLAGDGELGQKVYSTAKDGKQALISHTHAMEMVRRSPRLAAECKINKSTSQITHVPTSSVYRVVAGDNPKSQEGLNGSVLVDETHVVDRPLMKILKGAGISRSEPLHLEVSTAGNNPDGYGRERYLYGKDVEAGKVEDEAFLFVCYEAPQDLADADLDADPVKYGKLANPAWGHTIMESEYVADYQTSKRSLTELLDFKMYRLNIWQASANPWLRSGDWDKCKRDFQPADLAGRDCAAGLDLSRTRDMCALVLVFPGDAEEEFSLLPYFWLPEKRAREIASLVPQILGWERSGALELTPGDVVDYGFIKARFRELAKLFNIQELCYDPRFAEEVTQSLEQGQVDAQGVQIEEGTGVPRCAVAQNDAMMGPPTDDFERLVIAGKLHHNGHPVLSWQVGHVKAKKGPSGVKRLLKPAVNDVRTIDGLAAAVMGLGKPDGTAGPGFGAKRLLAAGQPSITLG